MFCAVGPILAGSPASYILTVLPFNRLKLRDFHKFDSAATGQ